jgi:hypothetical protein
MLRSLHSIRENADVPKNGAETQKTGSCYAGRNIFYNIDPYASGSCSRNSRRANRSEKRGSLWPIGSWNGDKFEVTSNTRRYAAAALGSQVFSQRSHKRGRVIRMHHAGMRLRRVVVVLVGENGDDVGLGAVLMEIRCQGFSGRLV